MSERARSRAHFRSIVVTVATALVATSLTATWLPVAPVSAAEVSFDLDQCANGEFEGAGSPKEPCDWVNGNLNDQNSQYREGDSVAYRAKVSGATATGNTITIEYDSIEGGVHAFDYLTSWNQTESGNPCLDVDDCDPADFTTEPIPVDPRLALGPDGVAGGGDEVTQIPGVFTCYGCTITAVSGYTHSDPDPNTTGTNKTSITITFDAAVDNPVVAWGGHIASRADWRPDPNAVTDTQGSPYHMRNGGAGGQQDRSLKASAVIFPASITIIKQATPEDGTDFGFTTTSADPPNLSPSSFTLDDANPADVDAFINTQAFPGLENFTTYTITESSIPADWSLADIVCTVVDANGGAITEDLDNDRVEIELAEGELITCTFVNTKGASLTINKDAIPNDAQDFAYTTTGDGLSAFSLDDDGGAVGESTALLSTKTFPISAFGTKTITESPVEGWTLTGISCTKNGVALEGEDNLTTRTASVTLAAGDTVVCDFVNTEHATLEITKDAVPNHAQDFAFTTSGTGLSGFTLDDDAGASGADGTFPNTTSFPLDTSQFGGKQITEGAVTGWTLTEIVCAKNGAALTGEDDLVNRRATVTIAAGDSVECTFVNTGLGTVRVIKLDNGQAATRQWRFTLDGPSGPLELTTNFEGEDNVLDFGQLPIGEYTLCEVDIPAGWDSTLTSAQPVNGRECKTFTLDPGEDEEDGIEVNNIPCPQGGTVTVTKDIPSGGAPVSFTYTLQIPGTDPTLVLSFEGNETEQVGVLNVPAGVIGTFTLTESENGSNDKFVPNNPTSVTIQPAECAAPAGFSGGFAPSARARVIKTEEPVRGQRRNATGKWTFYLIGPDQSADGDFVNEAGLRQRTKRTNTKGARHILGFNNLLPGDYMLCEKFFRGWKSNLAKKYGGIIQPNGDVCVEFTLDPNQSRTFRVNNACPRGNRAPPGT